LALGTWNLEFVNRNLTWQKRSRKYKISGIKKGTEVPLSIIITVILLT
jgi:hypothetical protein